MDSSGSRSPGARAGGPNAEAAELSLRQAAAEEPSRVALVTPAGTCTFRELWRRVQVEMVYLRSQGVTKDRPLAVVGTNDLTTLVRLYSAIELGVPLALLHERATADEHGQWIEVWGAQEVPWAASVSGASGPPRGDGRAPVPEVSVPEVSVPEVSVPEVSGPADDSILAIVRTSGTGGRPKGVCLSRGAFKSSAAASAANLGWRDDDRWLLTLPVAHVGGLSILIRCLAARRTIVVDPDEHFVAEAMMQRLERQAVTLVSVVPTMLRRLVATGLAPPKSLRAVLVGGGAASPKLLAEAVQQGWPVLTTYGCTEACSQVTTQAYGSTWSPSTGAGRPLEGQQVRIRDGRIEMRGPTLMSGYLPPGGEPFTADGWLRSGDLGRLDADGGLHVLGRADDVIISGGENVAPLRVERILEEHCGVEAACVFGLDDPTWGQLVVAAVVPSSSGRPPEDAWQRFLQDHLAPYERPRKVRWVEALVVNGVGKLDRRATAARLRPLLSGGPTEENSQHR